MSIECGLTVFREHGDNISILDCSCLNFNKNFDFDNHQDWSQLLKDKAISPYLSDWKTVYGSEHLGFLPEPIRSYDLFSSTDNYLI